MDNITRQYPRISALPRSGGGQEALSLARLVVQLAYFAHMCSNQLASCVRDPEQDLARRRQTLGCCQLLVSCLTSIYKAVRSIMLMQIMAPGGNAVLASEANPRSSQDIDELAQVLTATEYIRLVCNCLLMTNESFVGQPHALT